MIAAEIVKTMAVEFRRRYRSMVRHIFASLFPSDRPANSGFLPATAAASTATVEAPAVEPTTAMKTSHTALAAR